MKKYQHLKNMKDESFNPDLEFILDNAIKLEPTCYFDKVLNAIIEMNNYNYSGAQK